MDAAVAAAAVEEVPTTGAAPTAAVSAACAGAARRGQAVVEWAVGIGLDRLAMVLHGIPDMRGCGGVTTSAASLNSGGGTAAGGWGRGGRGGGSAADAVCSVANEYPPAATDQSFRLPAETPAAVAAAAAAAAAAPPPASAAVADPAVAVAAADVPWRNVENLVGDGVRGVASVCVEAVTRVREPRTRAGRASPCNRGDVPACGAELDARQRRRGAGAGAGGGGHLGGRASAFTAVARGGGKG